MSQESFNPKIWFISQKVCSAHTHTDTVNTEDTVSGFQEFFLQPIIKDRPNIWDSILSIQKSLAGVAKGMVTYIQH